MEAVYDTSCQLHVSFYIDHNMPPNVTQKSRNATTPVQCSWEYRPVGCMKVNCPFLHKKSRSINGLFLPPSINNMVITDNQESMGIDADVSWVPIHPPVVINLTSDDDYDDGEEEEKQTLDKLEQKVKTPEELEEEKLIMDICCKSGEYYRTPLTQAFYSKTEVKHIQTLLNDGDFEGSDDDYYCQQPNGFNKIPTIVKEITNPTIDQDFREDPGWGKLLYP